MYTKLKGAPSVGVGNSQVVEKLLGKKGSSGANRKELRGLYGGVRKAKQRILDITGDIIALRRGGRTAHVVYDMRGLDGSGWASKSSWGRKLSLFWVREKTINHTDRPTGPAEVKRVKEVGCNVSLKPGAQSPREAGSFNGKNHTGTLR